MHAPDTGAQLTSDHGFDLTIDADRLAPIIAELNELGIRVSVFMDPDISQIRTAREIGADRIELYIGPYARASDASGREAVLQRFVDAASAATDLGLGFNAGHDLNLHNLRLFAERIPTLLVVSIGHAFTVDCIAMGLPAAVAAYQRCLGKSPSDR